MLSEKYYEELRKYEALINRKNEIDTDFYNGVYDKYKYPVLTILIDDVTNTINKNISTIPKINPFIFYSSSFLSIKNFVPDIPFIVNLSPLTILLPSLITVQ